MNETVHTKATGFKTGDKDKNLFYPLFRFVWFENF